MANAVVNVFPPNGGATTTLYDEEGNPVSVRIVNGERLLSVQDKALYSVLGDILGELREIKTLLASQL